MNAYTSYDKYAGTNGNTKDIDVANNVSNAETIYGISGGVKIAVDLLDNPNYGEKTFTISLLKKGSSESETLFTYSSTTFGTNTVSVGDKGGLNWTSYDLTATIAFAGETVSRTNSHHITGLPYSVDFDANRNNNMGWTFTEAYWINTGLATKLILNEGFIVSPKYHIPDAVIPVDVFMQGKNYGVGSNVSTYTVGSTSSTNLKAVNNLAQDTTSGNLNTYVVKEDMEFQTALSSMEPYMSVTASKQNSYVYLIKLPYR